MKKLTLIQKFFLIAVIYFIFFGVIFGQVNTYLMENKMLAISKEQTALFVQAEVTRELQIDDLITPKTGTEYKKYFKIMKHLNFGPNIEQVTIWNKDQTVLWSDEESLIGQHFPGNNELKKAFEGEITSEIIKRKQLQEKYMIKRKFERILELYIPIRFEPDGDIDVVFEIYQNFESVYADISYFNKIIWTSTFSGITVLFILLFGLVKRASRRIEIQHREIRQSKEEWEETFNTINEAITIHDKDFNIVRSNRASEELLGLPLLTITRQKCYESYHGTDCPPEGCPSCQVLKTGKPTSIEIFEPKLNKYIEIKALPRLDAGNHLIGLVHVVRDITDRKKAEKEQQKLQSQLIQAQKMESIGTLAGGIAHDFNNILNVIIGFSSLIEMNMREDDPLRTNLKEIFSASERATHLTQSLLSFSRKQIMVPKYVNLNEIVNGVKKMLARIISEDIELMTRLTEEELTVMADSVQIEQVLINLATNARDVMPDGGSLTIETELVELDDNYIKMHGFGKIGKYVLISISDTGFGIDEATKTKIFEPFFTTKELGKGTGLGLSMVYGIIKQHNGYINVYSEPGEGTTFRIYLPVIKAVSEKMQPSSGHVPVQGGTETILVAEDDRALRRLSKDILEKNGYTVVEAVDGDDAISKFRENTKDIQLLLLDVIMPKKNGKDVYEEIKKIRSDIKALFLSGYTSDHIQRKRVLEEGINFIFKPVSVNDLLRKVREVLDK
jgi:signal transduction histidine kinase/CheY-like chemotaxis protein